MRLFIIAYNLGRRGESVQFLYGEGNESSFALFVKEKENYNFA
jgi:hypothetical protein